MNDARKRVAEVGLGRFSSAQELLCITSNVLLNTSSVCITYATRGYIGRRQRGLRMSHSEMDECSINNQAHKLSYSDSQRPNYVGKISRNPKPSKN